MAAAMTAAMLASAVPASAAALGTSTLEPLPPMHVVQEVYGDLNGLYFDMGYTYTDGSYVIQNPMAVSRSIQSIPKLTTRVYRIRYGITSGPARPALRMAKWS